MAVRSARVVGAAALAGLVFALAVTLVLPETYRASGVLVLSREGRAPGDDPEFAPAARAAAELLESRTVTETAIANLRLGLTPDELLARLEVDVDAGTSLLRFGVEARDPEEARRTAQEVAEVFAVLYNTRFGPRTTASIWQAPRVEADPVSPQLGLNAALGLVGGALAGVAWATLRQRPRPLRRRDAHEGARTTAGWTLAPRPVVTPPAAAPPPGVGVAERLATLTERELKLARKAAELAVRERELEGAFAALATPPEPKQEPDRGSAEAAEPERAPGGAAERHPPSPFPADLHALRADELGWLVGGWAPPDRLAELEAYVAALREVADVEGRLPESVRHIVEDVFADLHAEALGTARTDTASLV